MTLTRTRAQMVREEAGGGSRRKKEADALMQTAQQLQPDFPPVLDYFRYREVCLCACIFYVEIAPFRRHLPVAAGVLSRLSSRRMACGCMYVYMHILRRNRAISQTPAATGRCLVTRGTDACTCMAPAARAQGRTDTRQKIERARAAGRRARRTGTAAGRGRSERLHLSAGCCWQALSAVTCGFRV